MKFKSGHIGLRALEEADAPVLQALADNRNIFDRVRDFFPHPYSLSDAQNFIDFCRQSDPPVNLGITWQDKLAGVCGLVLQTDIYRHSAEIGFWLGEPYWNQGIASGAVNLLLRYAFEQFQVERVYAGVFSNNPASARVLERNGFIEEGRMRQGIVKNGEFLDEVRYGLLRKEFKASR